MLEQLLAVLCGSFVGFALGLLGGGGSILATPLLIYVIGLGPHQAIGTGALAVSASAFANFASHFRAGNVRWRSAGLFAAVGMLGAFIGSQLGKSFDGRKLLFLFAILMIVVGVRMFRSTAGLPIQDVPAGFRFCNRRSIPKIAASGLGVGLLSGFFGIGGGFLIVPALLFSTGMPMLLAVGSSLLGVAAFGLTTAVNYAISGLIDWPVAAEYIGGGIIGGWIGMQLACRLSSRKTVLKRIFSSLVCIVALYMLYENAAVFHLV
ncbi:sulfite exporter TauE/SafE family protein [Lichenicoccus roseus]|uniref:Probable membrane transporter protein n=1 Tax=Lichenicoccus roseus TaxID=2683649 RepID=A0A5R9J6G5_9PROT|nr:sulfite exporter TauE/SafE family protein [Lichenicoccus roseus]